MPDNESFVHDFLQPDSNTRRFHAGDACQWSPPVPEGEVDEAVAGMIAAHRAEIHAPGSRVSGAFGLDEDGNPIETSYLGVGVDPESGALLPLDNDGNVRGDGLVQRAARALGEGDSAEETEQERQARREREERERQTVTPGAPIPAPTPPPAPPRKP